ncbi:MAG: DNA internalization-related competence protein ComEC/Rec2 [Candidatus Omnitrophica bacterium]|nr:DNA internalization-related competence protein ComEC/Rec2 [Candidatus Omnitrophota bacterium]
MNPKRPIVYLAIPLCLGIFTATLFKIPLVYPFILSSSLLILALSFLKKNIVSHVTLYLAIFFLGVFLFKNSDILEADHISRFTPEDEKKVFLRGAVVDDPIISTPFYKSEKTAFVLNAHSFKEDSVWKRATGLVKVDVYRNTMRKGNLGFGDEVILEGLISRPNSLRNPGQFDYSKYLEIKNIHSVLKVKDGSFIKPVGIASSNPVKKAAYNIRHRIRNSIDEYFNAPFNGFLKAILIGDRSTLKTALKEDFVKTGTVHILAISGLHVGLIAGLFLFLFGLLRIPLKPKLALTAVLVIFYSFIAGSSPPIVRSAIMFSIFVLGYLLNREADILNSLAAAMFLILLWNPKELFDPSFQLSFASIASIVIFAPKIDGIFGLNAPMRYSSVGRIRAYLLKSVSVSIAAWLGVWPLIAFYFNIISPVAIIANIIAIPALFVMMAVSFLFIFVREISNYLAQYPASVLYIIQKILFFINHRLSGLPLSHFRIASPSVELTLLYYALISLLILPIATTIRGIKIHRKHLLMVILLLFNISIWRHVINLESEFLKVTFLDVGQGDSILLELPKRGAILIDGGSGGEEEKFDIGRAVIAPYLWNNGIYRLDAIIATHFHEDHLGGIPYILKNFDVGCIIDNGTATAPDNRLYNRYKRIINGKGIRHLIVGEGDEVRFSNDVRLFILNPVKDCDLVDSNDNSIVVKLVYKGKSVLFCGDITDKAMKRLASYGGFLKSDILKVPHHGGRLGDSDTVGNFFKKVSPEISIISVGRKNRFKAPSDNTLKIITSLSSVSYTTKYNGAIILLIDGRAFKAEAFVKK